MNSRIKGFDPVWGFEDLYFLTVTGLHCSPANELRAERNGAKSRVDGKFWTDSDLRLPESLNACPESLNVNLESLNVNPESLNAYPESLNVNPESLNAYPESLNAYPESLITLTESLNAYPESLNGLSDLNSANGFFDPISKLHHLLRVG